MRLIHATEPLHLRHASMIATEPIGGSLIVPHAAPAPGPRQNPVILVGETKDFPPCSPRATRAAIVFAACPLTEASHRSWRFRHKPHGIPTSFSNLHAIRLKYQPALFQAWIADPLTARSFANRSNRLFHASAVLPSASDSCSHFHRSLRTAFTPPKNELINVKAYAMNECLNNIL